MFMVRWRCLALEVMHGWLVGWLGIALGLMTAAVHIYDSHWFNDIVRRLIDALHPLHRLHNVLAAIIVVISPHGINSCFVFGATLTPGHRSERDARDRPRKHRLQEF